MCCQSLLVNIFVIMCKGVLIMFDLFNHVPLYFNTIPKFWDYKVLFRFAKPWGGWPENVRNGVGAMK